MKREVISLGTILALVLVAGVVRADPIGYCLGDGGGVASAKVLRVPVRMVAEDVRITQDPTKSWWWNVRAEYRFENLTKEPITIPVAFPADTISSTACSLAVEGFQARVNGVKAGGGWDPGWAGCQELDAECPLARFAGPEKTGGTTAQRELERFLTTCDQGGETCFAATFPPGRETVMVVTYAYFGLPRDFGDNMLSFEEDLIDHVNPVKGHPAVTGGLDLDQQVRFVLQTGAYWAGTIGHVKLTIAVNDIPYGLDLCYGARCSDFEKSRSASLGDLSASIEDDGTRTTMVIEGRDVEPDADIEMSYARGFYDLLSLLTARCGYSAGGVLRPDFIEQATEAKLRLCRHLPHHFLGYNLVGKRLQDQIRTKVAAEKLYRGGGKGVRTGLEPFGDPRARHRWPASLKISNELVRRRGLRQLDTIDVFLAGIDELLGAMSAGSAE